MPNITNIDRDYEILRDQVKATLLEGQWKIEQAKVHTYWEIRSWLIAHGSSLRRV